MEVLNEIVKLLMKEAVKQTVKALREDQDLIKEIRRHIIDSEDFETAIATAVDGAVEKSLDDFTGGREFTSAVESIVEDAIRDENIDRKVEQAIDEVDRIVQVLGELAIKSVTT